MLLLINSLPKNFYIHKILYTLLFCLNGYRRIFKYPLAELIMIVNNNFIDVPKFSNYLLLAIDLFKTWLKGKTK